MTAVPQTVLGNRYLLQGPIGGGVSGAVLLALDTHENNSPVAIKLLQGHPNGTWAEAAILRALADDHILPIRNADLHLGQAILVTDVAGGGTVADRIDNAAPCGVDPDAAIHWIRQACNGVDRAHRAGLIHNDLKPGNLFLGDRAECMVGDFGGAGLLDASGTAPVFAASPQTVAPEVATQWPLGRATLLSDVYSMAATAYWTLAGVPTFDPSSAPPGSNDVGVMHAAGTHSPAALRDIAPHIPPYLATAIHRSLALNPAARHQSIGAFAAALQPTNRPSRAWVRTDEHSGHVSCWRGTPSRAASPYVLCLVVDANVPNRLLVETTYAASGRHVPRGAETATKSNWPLVVRRVMRRLG